MQKKTHIKFPNSKNPQKNSHKIDRLDGSHFLQQTVVEQKSHKEKKEHELKSRFQRQTLHERIRTHNWLLQKRNGFFFVGISLTKKLTVKYNY